MPLYSPHTPFHVRWELAKKLIWGDMHVTTSRDPESLEATYVVSERVSMDYRKYPKKVGDLYLYLSGQSLPKKEVDRHTTHIFP